MRLADKAATTEAKAGKPAKAAKAGKPTKAEGLMGRYQVRAQRLLTEARKLHAAFLGWRAATPPAEAREPLASASLACAAIVVAGEKLDGQVAALVSVKFVPSPAARAPKFPVGARVKIRMDRIEDYTKRGLYTVKEVSDLEVTALASTGGEARAKIRGTEREIHIRSVNHLEAFA